jgi:hypothetical protein
MLLLANFGTEGKQQQVIAKVSQETRADVIGTTRLGGPGLICEGQFAGYLMVARLI